MAKEIIDTCRYGYYMGMSLTITDPNLQCQPRNQIRPRRNSPAYVRRMDLNFKLQLRCQHFQTCEEGNRNTTTLLCEHISSQHHLATLELIPISIFKHGDRTTLEGLLYQEFQMYRDIINIELVVDEIINHWVRKVEEEEEEDQENSTCRVFEKIYPLEVVIELLVFETSREIDHQPQVMTAPTSESDVESMLKGAEDDEEIMELDNDKSVHCVICLEEIRKEEEGRERSVLQMPCLNMFHWRNV